MPPKKPGIVARLLIAGALMGLAGAAPAQQSESPPNLCINTPGHTAPVFAIAFSGDGNRLYTAGLDKAVRAWRLPQLGTSANDPNSAAVLKQRLWSDEKTFRWGVARGQLGSIYAMAISPATGELSIGGYGERGWLGDIVDLNPENGSVMRGREGHRETIGGLAYSQTGKYLASIDYAGAVLLWNAAGGNPAVLRTPHAARLDAATAREILLLSPHPAVTVVGDRWVVVAGFAGRGPNNRLTWRLDLYDTQTQTLARTLDPLFYDSVLALASSADGRWLAASDRARQLLLYDFQSGTSKMLPVNLPVFAMAFSAKGEMLVAGSAPGVGGGNCELQIWDPANGQITRRQPLTDCVSACAISSDGRRIAYTGSSGHDVRVEEVGGQGSLLLQGGQEITAVTFLGTSGYKLGFRATGANGEQTREFSPEKLDLSHSTATILPAETACGQWQAAMDTVSNRVTLSHSSGFQRVLEIDRKEQGCVRCFCWIPGPQGEPAAIAVGTSIQCGVYVYGLDGGMLRYFRGHQDTVSALAVSPDRKYLVSGSSDGSIRYWTLSNLGVLSALRQRWGGELSEQAGRLMVTAVDECSPLDHRKVAANDEITEIQWLEGGVTRSEKTPQGIAQRLVQVPWYTMVTFWTARQGQPRAPFNLRAGWQELFSLYTVENEWIAWTPAGYYACSGAGERLIGWQINKPFPGTPTFCSADQYHKSLYQPEIIQKLLGAQGVKPAEAQQPVVPKRVADIRPPWVKITAPVGEHAEVHATEIAVAAETDIVGDQPVKYMRLWLDGRPYGERRVPRPDERLGNRWIANWRVENLTPGTHQVAVEAETAESKVRHQVEVTCTIEKEVRPSLYGLVVGISEYPGNLRLRFGHSDARALRTVLVEHGKGLYENIEIEMLLNGFATKTQIESQLIALQKKPKLPIDVVVFFFAGHGGSDFSRFYMVPIDGSFDNLPNTGVSEERVRELCKTKAKVMIFLDACRSGGITHNFNKMALEYGSDLGACLIAAAKANQASLEDPKWEGGAFTRVLVDGLAGAAAAPGENYVFCPLQLQEYVDRKLSALTENVQQAVCNSVVMDRFAITKAR